MPESLGVNTARREELFSEIRLPAIVPSLLVFLRFAGLSLARSAGLEPATF
jgi:ABC-type nitrate/sulfonate/bicarbonate transport system permease component